MRYLRVRAIPVAVCLLAGLLLGIAGPLAGKWDDPVAVALHLVLSGGWSWAGYAFLVGYFSRSKTESALLSSCGLTIGVIAYYLYKHISPLVPVGMEYAASGGGISSVIIIWGAMAFLLGAPVGLLGYLARTPGVRGLAFRLVVPFVAFYETSMRLAVEAERQGPMVGATWQLIRVVAVAAAFALVVHAARSWWQARRARSWRPSVHVGESTVPISHVRSGAMTESRSEHA
ncbi:hypothetical protein [Streptomyces bohaiensis]|uniref:hypothetical protein n=1 Tax=Streptomyces bohaiensis TaxID=1431344 RepID=UPI001ADD73BC|nr:hypothetical protein [Streptomyces bohaiensis]